jgi:hypothetical protein
VKASEGITLMSNHHLSSVLCPLLSI